MFDYAICEIKGKQYKVLPNIPFQVDYLGENRDNRDIEVKVLIAVFNGKLQIGKPYLKEKVTLKVIENIKGKKIRVSKYHAKANYRRTTGIKPKYTKVLFVKKA